VEVHLCPWRLLQLLLLLLLLLLEVIQALLLLVLRVLLVVLLELLLLRGWLRRRLRTCSGGGRWPPSRATIW
jgi:hypothetical protein